MLHASLAGAWGQLDTFGTGAGAPPCSMTAAELRILRFLPTHLSFREIAERTFVSANTIKTQANAVYRKLGRLLPLGCGGAGAGVGPARRVSG